MASIIHRIPMEFMHIGGSPILFSFPGVQTHSFVPLTKTVKVPSAAISATVASLVPCSGPERRALVILGSSPLSVMYWPPGVGSLDTVSFRPVSSIVETPDRAAVWPELLVSQAAPAIVVARNPLRVFIDAHSPVRDLREDLASRATRLVEKGTGRSVSEKKAQIHQSAGIRSKLGQNCLLVVFLEHESNGCPGADSWPKPPALEIAAARGGNAMKPMPAEPKHTSSS